MAVLLIGIAAIVCPMHAHAADSNVVRVFHADSLRAYAGDLAAAYQAAHPGSEVQHEGSGSLDAIRKITDLHRPCDVLITADWRLLTASRPGLGGWAVVFAGNSMGILFTEKSKDAAAISADNWFDILDRPGVRYGHSNPARDPAGYWTLILWRLAENFYRKPGLAKRLAAGCPLSNIRPHNIDLISLLESGDLDYYFGYASDARLGPLKFLSLPPQINLSDVAMRKDYAVVTVKAGGATIAGAPIAYGVTIPNDAPNPSGAMDFVKLILGAQGQAIAAKAGLISYSQPLADDSANRMPATLRALTKPIAGN